MRYKHHIKFSQFGSVGFLLTSTVIIVIICIGMFIAKDYGITLDEEVELKMVAWNLELLSGDRDSIPSNLEYYR